MGRSSQIQVNRLQYNPMAFMGFHAILGISHPILFPRIFRIFLKSSILEVSSGGVKVGGGPILGAFNNDIFGPRDIHADL